MELNDAFVFESEIQIISGKNKNTRVFIPRISLFSHENDFFSFTNCFYCIIKCFRSDVNKNINKKNNY